MPETFDAVGDNMSGSHSRDSDGQSSYRTSRWQELSYRRSNGSNYWQDSNMRSWLNSTAAAGNVTWLCGNPPDEDHVLGGYNEYDQEAGFLTNFSAAELNAIKTVTQKSIVSSPEYDNGIYTTGTESLGWSAAIAGVAQNYDNAYAEYVTDRMFLFDVKQVDTVYNNGDILGDDYYIGKSTTECIENSEYDISDMNSEGGWSYWLRSPNTLGTDLFAVGTSDAYARYSDDAYYSSVG